MSTIVFLDANTLAKPFTRTLLWVGSRHSDFAVTWSERAETEANRHLRPGATPVGQLRERYGMALGTTGTDPERFGSTEEPDRQILADALACRSVFLVTEDVDDFGLADLASCGISAVHPDLFLAHRLSPAGYRAALEALSAGMSRPARRPADVHTQAGRVHPLLVGAMRRVYPEVTPEPASHNQPQEMFRGTSCVRCGRALRSPGSVLCGVGPVCASTPPAK